MAGNGAGVGSGGDTSGPGRRIGKFLVKFHVFDELLAVSQLDMGNFVGQDRGHRILAGKGCQQTPAHKNMAPGGGKGVQLRRIEDRRMIPVIHIRHGGIDRDGGADVIQVFGGLGFLRVKMVSGKNIRRHSPGNHGVRSRITEHNNGFIFLFLQFSNLFF